MARMLINFCLGKILREPWKAAMVRRRLPESDAQTGRRFDTKFLHIYDPSVVTGEKKLSCFYRVKHLNYISFFHYFHGCKGATFLFYSWPLKLNAWLIYSFIRSVLCSLWSFKCVIPVVKCVVTGADTVCVSFSSWLCFSWYYKCPLICQCEGFSSFIPFQKSHSSFHSPVIIPKI